MKETENFLASELNRLSLNERSKATEDVHCVGESSEEDPSLLLKSLKQIDEELKREKNPIYELAAIQDKSFVEDEEFRTKFLRADFYDAKKAVRRMVTFLKYKLTYFGQDKLTKEITLADLDEEDMDLMTSGLFHIQNEKDRSGRVIIYLFNNLLGSCSAKALIRVSTYIWWNILIPQPEVQLKGLVGVYYDMPGKDVKFPNFKFMLTIGEFTNSLPMRFSSIQCCMKSGKGSMALNNAILGIMMTIYPPYTRIRTRLHYGSDMELQYKLQSHGIPVRTCPVDSSGLLRRDLLHVWLDQRRRKEDLYVGFGPQTDASKGIVEPTFNDVLCGRGKNIQNHSGNIHFRNWSEGYRAEYDKAPRSKRRRIARELACMLERSGVRFLKPTKDNEWTKCDAMEAEDKIGQLFRSIRKLEAK